MGTVMNLGADATRARLVRKRAYLTRELRIRVIEGTIRSEVQEDGLKSHEVLLRRYCLYHDRHYCARNLGVDHNAIRPRCT